MSLTIEFSPQEEASIAYAAQKEGTDEATLLKRLVREHLPQLWTVTAGKPDSEAQALLDLLQSWREEDATDDVEELERRDAETQSFLAQLQENRLRLREPQI